MVNLRKTFAGVAASSAAWGWLHHKSSIKNRKSLCHCERSEAISLHNSLFLVRHSIFTTTFFFLLLLFIIASPAHAKYGGGTGEPNDPYLIFDANQMNAIGLHEEDWDKHFVLINDVNLAEYTGTKFNIIGNSTTKFTGIFDGNDHKILNFKWKSWANDCIGLFGCVGTGGQLKNLAIENVDVTSARGNNVGGLVGWNHEGTITNCYSTGNVGGNKKVGGLVGYNRGTITNSYSTGIVGGRQDIGGLVGGNAGTIIVCYSTGSVQGSEYIGGLGGLNFGTITNCYSTGSVSGNEKVGGVVGWNYSGTITECYFTGSVTASGNGIGGLVGDNTGMTMISACYSTANVKGNDVVGGLVGISSGYGSISDCYATGSVRGNDRVGGLMGLNLGTVSACYSKGNVSGTNHVGGLVGDGPPVSVVNCFWDIETSDCNTSAGGIGKTTADMQTASTFIGWGGCGNEGIWTLDEGNDYPHLWWEEKPGDPLPAYQLSDFITGAGTQIDPYLIYTAEQLNMIGLIGCHLDKHFKLMADIDLSSFTGTAFNIIGYWYGSIDNKPFTGVFDGNGHTISNFSYTSTYRDNIGLFGYVDDPNAQIKDLGLIDPNVDAGKRWYVGSLVGYLRDGKITNCYAGGGSVSGQAIVGGLVGHNYSGTITGCYATGSVSGGGYVGGLVGFNYGTMTNSYSSASVTGDDRVGGLVGENGLYGTVSNCYATAGVSGADLGIGGLVGWNYGIITNCYSAGSVSGNRYVGGLVGRSNHGTITNCYSTSSVTGGNWGVGGLVGYNPGGTITNCYATGSVSGNYYYVGGLVGWNRDDSKITNSYSTGRVSGNEYVGGLVGKSFRHYINDSFWDIDTSGQSSSDGGTGKTTAEMQTRSTFTDAGWDFVGETFNGIADIWFIPHQDYPHLWWEGMQVPMQLTPRTLNCRSKGNWVKAHLTLPEGFTVADVDSNRPAVLHSFGFQSAPLYVFVNENELVEIEAAFEREAVCSLAGDWPEALTVAGFLTDGNIFLGTSTVRMIAPGLKEIEELALYWLNADCDQPDWCDGIDLNRDSMVNLLDYALLLNSQVEFIRE